jgi:hypothetical protein
LDRKRLDVDLFSAGFAPNKLVGGFVSEVFAPKRLDVDPASAGLEAPNNDDDDVFVSAGLEVPNAPVDRVVSAGLEDPNENGVAALLVSVGLEPPKENPQEPESAGLEPPKENAPEALELFGLEAPNEKDSAGLSPVDWDPNMLPLGFEDPNGVAEAEPASGFAPKENVEPGAAAVVDEVWFCDDAPNPENDDVVLDGWLEEPNGEPEDCVVEAPPNENAGAGFS